MCIEIYIGLRSNEHDLTVSDSVSGFWSRQLPPGPKRVRAMLELETVYEVGSFLGCTCGLYFGDWSRREPSEHHDKRVDNVVEFRNLLQHHESLVERILTLESYEIQSLDQFPKHPLDLQSMSENASEFSFDADCIYELVR